ncbi:hypothetical protein C7421_112144 [Pantoea ananatis]|nr:hypothetical protein C7421_112144 [Pantoea ananatis]
MNGSPESVGIMDSCFDSAVLCVYLNVRFWHEADVLTELKVRFKRKVDVKIMARGMLCHIRVTQGRFAAGWASGMCVLHSKRS